jgi:hypothetical protein
MKKRTRPLAAIFAIAILLAPAAAFAAAPSSEIVVAFTEESSEDVVEDMQPVINDSGIVPAVEVLPPAESVPEQPWTIRFMSPLFGALGVGILLAVTLHYAFRVRGRYSVED